MSVRSGRGGRLLRWLLAIVVVVAVGLYLALPAVFAVAAVTSAAADVGEPPAGFEAIRLETADGVSLAGWYAPPENGAAIVLLHGAGETREAVRPYAEMLRRNGYGALALDARGHGESEGETNRLGWMGTEDVRAAVAFLEREEAVEAMGGLGLSMGGEILLGAAGENPALRAMVADGATRRSVKELTALPSERSLYRNFTARVMYALVGLLSGEEPPQPLLESMVEAEGSSFLLIAAGTEEMEVAFNELFAERLGERARLWVAAEATHTGAFGRYPEEYERRVVGFFGEELLQREGSQWSELATRSTAGGVE